MTKTHNDVFSIVQIKTRDKSIDLGSFHVIYVNNDEKNPASQSGFVIDTRPSVSEISRLAVNGIETDLAKYHFTNRRIFTGICFRAEVTVKHA